MATVEVDEVELLNLRRLQGIASKITANPAAKKLLETAYKTVDPNAPTPTLDQERIIQEPVQAALKRVEELQASIEKDRAERDKNEKLTALENKVQSGFAQLRKEGWQEDGIKLVDAFMKEHGIIDPLIAAASVEKQHPPQQPVTPSGSGAWNFFESIADGEADLKKMIETKGESTALIDKMTRDALNDIRGPSHR